MKTNYKSKHEKACLKRCVLRSVLKQLRSFTALIFDGNLFQSLGADAINDLPVLKFNIEVSFKKIAHFPKVPTHTGFTILNC